MKNSLIHIFIICFFISCSGVKKPKKPENLISKDQMVNILLDMSLMSSAKGINKSKIENNGINPKAFIYSKHQIDSIQFVESNTYYTYNLNEYQDIIKKVTDSLEILREQYNAIVEKEEKERLKLDSIKRSKRKNKGFLKEDLVPIKSLE